MENFISPMPGDIALVAGKTIKSRAIVMAQRIFRSTASYSHCAINVCGNVWCESMPQGGVQLLTTEEFLLSGRYSNTWEVLRPSEEWTRNSSSEESPPNFGKLDSLMVERQKWLKATLYFVGQSYNRSFGVRSVIRSNSSAFCSQLVANVYERMGYRVGKRPAYDVFPADLETLANDTPRWKKVGDDYKIYLAHSLHAAHESKLAETYKLILQLSAKDWAALPLFRLKSYNASLALAKLLEDQGIPFDVRQYQNELDAIEEGLYISLANTWRSSTDIRRGLRRVRLYRQDLLKMKT